MSKSKTKLTDKDRERIKKSLVRDIKKQGIEPDLIDLDALIDPDLTYSENKKLILPVLEKIDFERENTRLEIEQAQDFNERTRTERAQATDDNFRSKKLITKWHIARKPELLEKWYKNPELYDIEGVDAHSYSIVRKTPKTGKKKTKKGGKK